MGDRANRSRRQFLKATSGLAAGAAVAGCLDDDTEIDDDGDLDLDEDDDDETGVDDDSGPDEDDEEQYLRMINGTMDSMDPIRSTLAATGTVLNQVFDGLTYEPNGELAIENQIAEEYDVSDDFLTYTFHLKEGVQYHGDWGEVTADDFVYAWERLAASENSRRRERLLDFLGVSHETDDEGAYEPGTLEMEAVDDYTFEFTLETPYHSVVELLPYRAFAPIPEDIVGDIEGYDGEMPREEFGTENPIGTGPFRFEEWEAGSHLSLERFDDYHGQVAEIDGVHWSIMDDSNARFNRAMNRNLDVFTMEPSQFDAELLDVEETDDGRELGTYGPLSNDETVQYQSSEVLVSYYIVFNTSNVDELAARRAIGHVIDQHELAANEFDDMYDPGYHIVPPSAFPGGEDNYREMAEAEYPYGYAESQIDTAREIMEEAGYGEDDMYEFSLTVYPDSIWQDFGELLASQARAAHIDIDVREAPQSTIINQAIEGTMDAFTLWDRMDYPGPDVFHRFLHPTPEMPQFTRISAGVDAEYADEAADAWDQYLDNRGESEGEAEARNEAFERIERANLEMVAQLPLLHERVHRFVYDWVDIDMHGSMEYQQYNTVSIDDQS